MLLHLKKFQAELLDPEGNVALQIAQDLMDLTDHLPDTRTHHFKVAIETEPQKKTRLRTLFCNSRMHVRGWGSERHVTYSDGAEVWLDHALSESRVFSSSAKRSRELVYLLLLSRLGETLDAEGYHRAHALGVQVAGQRALLVMDQGVGKSTLAAALAIEARSRQVPLSLFSDEIPLVSGQEIHPFPIRVALKEDTLKKLSLETSSFSTFERTGYGIKYVSPLTRLCPVAIPGKLDWVILGERDRSTEYGELRECSRLEIASALAQSMVIGLGTPQMAEYMVRLNPTHLRDLSRTALSRSTTAARISTLVSPKKFRLGHDPRQNARCLLNFLCVLQ